MYNGGIPSPIQNTYLIQLWGKQPGVKHGQSPHFKWGKQSGVKDGQHLYNFTVDHQLEILHKSPKDHTRVDSRGNGTTQANPQMLKS